jgi:integrase
MLTNNEIKAFKPRAKPYRKKDQGGLYLLCTPNGTKLWRYKYRIRRGDRRIDKLLALGAWPAVRLADARRLQMEAKTAVRDGRDPLAERMARRAKASMGAVETVEMLARAWHGRRAPRWVPRHAVNVMAVLERHVFPMLGKLHINDVTPPVMLACVREIEARGANATAHLARQYMDAIFGEAMAAGIATANPAAQIKKTLAPVIRGKQPAIVDLDELRQLMRRIETSPGRPPIKLAFRLLALTACRPSEVCGAAWRELEQLDGASPIWRIPRHRMKKRIEHIVPLPPQALAVIETIRPLTGHGQFVFPNVNSIDLPMSRSALLEALYRCEYRGVHSAHGFRSSFSSIMNERHPEDWAAIEAALAHVAGGTRGSYMRSNYLERRRQLMAEWADLLLDGVAPPETLLYGPRR